MNNFTLESIKKEVAEYQPCTKTYIDFKKELDTSIIFLSKLMGLRRTGIEIRIQNNEYPTINEVIKYANFINKYTGFLSKIGKGDNSSSEDFNPLRKRLEEIRKRKNSNSSKN